MDEWFIQNEVLIEMSADHEWFLPMIAYIAHELLMGAPWGLRGKVGMIFVLHYTNIILDLYLIFLNLGVIPDSRNTNLASEGYDFTNLTSYNSTSIDLIEGDTCDDLIQQHTLGLAMALTYCVQMVMKFSLEAAQNVDLERSEKEKYMSMLR